MTSAQVVIQTGEDGVVLPKRFQRFKQWRARIVSTYFLGVKVFGDKAIKNACRRDSFRWNQGAVG
jgi:hypothetical protein